jgi:hypothetical protein
LKSQQEAKGKLHIHIWLLLSLVGPMPLVSSARGRAAQQTPGSQIAAGGTG